MAEVLCVYREVKLIKETASAAKHEPSDAVAIVSYDEKPGIGYWQIEHTLGAFDESRKLCRQAGDGRAKVVAAVVTLARSDRRIAATPEQWDSNPWTFSTGE